MKFIPEKKEKKSSGLMCIATLVAGLIAVGFTAADPVSALPIDKLLTVNVIQVCDNNGLNCASTGPSDDLFYEKEVDKIWAQAGIDVDFVMGPQLWSTNFSNINDRRLKSSFFKLDKLYGGPSTSIVTMFMVHTVAGAYGEGWLGYGGLVIAMDSVMGFNSPYGRIDTIAHELGHNLGLKHYNSNSRFLMATGGVRNIPNTLANIYPDGLDYDWLPPDQINLVRRSSLLDDFPVSLVRDDDEQGDTPVPEPGSNILFSIGLASLVIVRRRFLVS